MHDKYMTLSELNEQLHFCWVDAEKLASMGFLPVVLSKVERDALDEATHRKWRNAKLYPISKLQDIRATIGASMRDACCEMRLLGRELANAETELPSGRSIVVEVAPGQTTVSLDDGEVKLRRINTVVPSEMMTLWCMVGTGSGMVAKSSVIDFLTL